MHLVVNQKVKGNFFYTNSNILKGGYDIYFTPEYSRDMQYVATVPSNLNVEKHCEFLEQAHNLGVEVYKVLESTVESITNFDNEEQIKKKIDEAFSEIEAILLRPLSPIEKEDIEMRIKEWDY